MIESFADLLFPHDPAVLLDAVNAHRRLLLHTDRADCFVALLPWDRLNALITPDRIASGRIEMARNGFHIPVDMSVVQQFDGTGRMSLNTAALQANCRQGLSIVINNIQGMERNIALMNAVVERELRALVHTNAYVSFTRESAFKPHWDNHNVLILQVHGRKRWRSWGQRELFPTTGRSIFANPAELGAAEWEGVLNPGDVMYVPRGDIHGAQVIDGEDSVHLTVTIVPPGIDALVVALARRCHAEQIARQDLPVIAPREDREAWMNTVKAVMHRAVDALDLDEVLAGLDEARGPLLFTSLGMSGRVTPERRFQPALRRRPPSAVFDAIPVTIRAGGQTWRLNEREAKVLEHTLDRHTVRAADLFPVMADVEPAAILQTIADLAVKGLLVLLED